MPKETNDAPNPPRRNETGYASNSPRRNEAGDAPDLPHLERNRRCAEPRAGTLGLAPAFAGTWRLAPYPAPSVPKRPLSAELLGSRQNQRFLFKSARFRRNLAARARPGTFGSKAPAFAGTRRFVPPLRRNFSPELGGSRQIRCARLSRRNFGVRARLRRNLAARAARREAAKKLYFTDKK